MPANLLMAPVLTGAFIFAADLLRALTARGADPDVDFVQLSSYGGARASSGVVTLLKDFSVPLEGRHVLLVDDVLDTGRSLHFAKHMVLDRGAASVRLCVLVRKATGLANMAAIRWWSSSGMRNSNAVAMLVLSARISSCSGRRWASST